MPDFLKDGLKEARHMFSTIDAAEVNFDRAKDIMASIDKESAQLKSVVTKEMKSLSAKFGAMESQLRTFPNGFAFSLSVGAENKPLEETIVEQDDDTVHLSDAIHLQRATGPESHSSKTVFRTVASHHAEPPQDDSASAMKPGDDVTLYKITDGECGQATLDAKYAKYAEKFATLAEGTCAAQGYSEAAGSKTMTVPILGEITVSLFKKPSTISWLAHIFTVVPSASSNTSTASRWQLCAVAAAVICCCTLAVGGLIMLAVHIRRVRTYAHMEEHLRSSA
jgi:hypothetical protein